MTEPVSWDAASQALPTWGEMESGVPLGRSSTARVLEGLSPMLDDAFQRFGRGEHVTWEIALQAFPDKPGPDAFWAPMVIVYASIKGLVLNTDIIMTSGPVQPNGWKQADADHIASELLKKLFDARVQESETMMTQAQEAMQNGQPAPHTGLIMP